MSILIFLWIASLAFYQYPVLGSLSVDNIGAPLMLLLALGWQQTQIDGFRRGGLVLGCLVFAPYFLTHLIARGTAPGAFFPLLYELSKTAIYFVTAVALCSNTRWRMSVFLGLAFVAVTVNLSNLAASFGVYIPPSERLTVSRLGIEWLPRSVGLFVNYGDQAIVSAIAVLISIGWIKRGKFGAFCALFVAASVVAGLLASQSRNVALTVAGGVVAFSIIYGVSSNATLVRRASIAFAASLLCTVVLLGAFYFADLVAELTNWGGIQASSTAADRLTQYKFALDGLKGNWLFGVEEAFYQRNQMNIEYIHNLWLREVMRAGLPGAIALVGIILLVAFLAVPGTKGAQRAVLRARAIAVSVCVAIGIATQFYIGGGYILWVILGVSLALARVSSSSILTKAKTGMGDEPLRRSSDLLNEGRSGNRVVS